MHIVYVGMKYDYGKPERGLSFEHYNFYDSLVHMGHDITYFDFMTEYRRVGKLAMNRKLIETVKSERPDLLFFVLFTDEFDIDVVKKISERSDTVTFNWFCDDHWRFDDYSRHWAPAFNWVSTTAASALSKYTAIGYRNAIKTQWACNHFLYRRIDAAPDYDVTFVGQPHGNRRSVIDRLRSEGIKVTTWGSGWEGGRLDQNRMIEIFNRSKINLNLSNASQPGPRSRLRYVLGAGNVSQIKARTFEIPGCGGFLLTDGAENLDAYYVPGTEIGVFRSSRDLVRQIGRYLDDANLRKQIARNGYARTLAEHTYERRFNDLFATMGFNK
jgi:spore maturation protein CgeB